MEPTQIEKIESPAPSGAYLTKAEDQALGVFNPKLWAQMEVVARTFVQSGAMPATIKNAPQMLMVLQAGVETGLKPIEALNSFYFVNGKIAMYGEKGLALVRRAGHTITWGECNDKTATITITRGDTKESLTSTFTLDMAKARGINNPVLAKYPENFLKFKAFHMTAKFIVPDALAGQVIGEAPDENVVGEIIAFEEKEYKAKHPNAESAPIKTASVSTPGHRPLDQVLEQPEEEPAKKSEKKKKPVKSEPVDGDFTEAAPSPEPEAKPETKDGDGQEESAEKEDAKAKAELDAEHAKYLTEKELTEEGLTVAEKRWLGSYHSGGR